MGINNKLSYGVICSEKIPLSIQDRDFMFDEVVETQKRGITNGSVENDVLCFLFTKCDSYYDQIEGITYGVDTYVAKLSLDSCVINLKFEILIPFDIRSN